MQQCPIYFDFHQAFPKEVLVSTCLQYKSFENTVGKGENARNEQFLLFPQCFLSFWRTPLHFHQIKNSCQKTRSFWKSLKLVGWQRFKNGETKENRYLH